jgi:hypothetical protein
MRLIDEYQQFRREMVKGEPMSVEQQRALSRIWILGAASGVTAMAIAMHPSRDTDETRQGISDVKMDLIGLMKMSEEEQL